ncbi:sigma-70 family RNA polymerase sigma factor [Spirosoma telluris]|uniref:RNA polymerase sigma factor n=1 Tax=Spirosoma telluris TaxID=2183553 RepID=UPI002FC324C0
MLDTVGRLNKLDSDAYLFDNAEFLMQPYEQSLVEEQLIEQQKLLVIAQLNKLPRRQKEILYLVYMKGLSYQQAAEVMDITMKSVYNTVNVALTTLRAYVRTSFEQGGALWVNALGFLLS